MKRRIPSDQEFQDIIKSFREYKDSHFSKFESFEREESEEGNVFKELDDEMLSDIKINYLNNTKFFNQI